LLLEHLTENRAYTLRLKKCYKICQYISVSALIGKNLKSV